MRDTPPTASVVVSGLAKLLCISSICIVVIACYFYIFIVFFFCGVLLCGGV